MRRHLLNLFSNLSARVIHGLLIILMTPLYIHILGTEAYGLIGFFNMIALFLFLFDLGLGTTLNRELAKGSAEEKLLPTLSSLTLSIEAVHLILCASCAILVALFSHFFATVWLKYQTLNQHDVTNAVYLIAANIFLLGPINLYTNGLLGLQRHTSLNISLAIFSIVRHLGSGLCLLFSPSIFTFFYWHLLSNLVQFLFLRHQLYKNIHKITRQKARIDLSLLKKIRRFSLGVSLSAFTAVLGVHGHKMFLSGLLDLSYYGYYAAATTLTQLVFCSVQSIQLAFFPAFSHAVASKAYTTLKESYHLGCQLMTVATFPVALIGAFFSTPILLLWTHNPQLSSAMGLTASILFIDGLLSSIMAIPHKAQLAFGWTSLSASYYSITAVVIPLSAYVSIGLLNLGTESIAITLALSSLAYCSLGSWVMYRRILSSEARRWLLDDILKPFVASTFAVAAFASFLPTSKFWQPFFLFALWIISTSVCILASKKINERVVPHIKGWLGPFGKSM